MAPLKLLISQVRRHSLTLTKPSRFSLSTRSLSTSSSDETPNPNPNPPKPTIQPVSYAVKPKPEPEFDSEQPDFAGGLTREDIRYVKDSAAPSHVAPLPEDKVVGDEEVKIESGFKESWEMGRERMRIEAMRQRSRRLFGGKEVEKEEEVNVPFPSIIPVEKKEKLPPLDLAEAIRQVKANAKRRFDESLEAHVRLGIDRKRTDLTVRGTVALPHGVGKVVRVAFFAEGADAEEARAAGADIVGGVDLVEEIARTGKLNADKCFSTPQFMTNLTKIARILGPQGLMPVPKRGTVTSDVAGAVKEAKRGVVDFKMDKTAIVHVGLGKVSYPEESLRENLCAFVNSLLLAKPAGLKKTSKYAGYVNSFHICSTMGPGFPVSIQSISKAADQYNKVHLK